MPSWSSSFFIFPFPFMLFPYPGGMVVASFLYKEKMGYLALLYEEGQIGLWLLVG